MWASSWTRSPPPTHGLQQKVKWALESWGARNWDLQHEGGRESKLSPLLKALERNCCRSGEASWSNLPMSPMSPQFPMLFCQEYKPFPDYLSKQAGKGDRKIWRSQCQLYSCSLRKPVAVSVSETPVNGEAWGKGWEEDGEIWGNGES